MKKVLIIDSGSGGVNILAKCVKACPSNNYLLFLDQKNLPYGEKTKQKLKEIATQIIKSIDSFFNPEIVIIGCNTLTCTTINFLRKTFKDKIFIGSEPAIKPALKKYKKDDVLVLATSVTIKYNRLLKDKKDICLSPKDLPKVIDENLFNRVEIENYLTHNITLKNKKCVVLGCTHFEGIKSEIKNIFGEIDFFESGEAIANRLKSFCDEDKSYLVQFMTSKNPENLGVFYEYFKLLMSEEKI